MRKLEFNHANVYMRFINQVDSFLLALLSIFRKTKTKEEYIVGSEEYWRRVGLNISIAYLIINVVGYPLVIAVFYAFDSYYVTLALVFVLFLLGFTLRIIIKVVNDLMDKCKNNSQNYLIEKSEFYKPIWIGSILSFVSTMIFYGITFSLSYS